MAQSMLTTPDNPYDPFTHFDEWFAYDESHGYHTCSLIARFAFTSPEMTPVEVDNVTEKALDEIVSLLPFYKKVQAATA